MLAPAQAPNPPAQAPAHAPCGFRLYKKGGAACNKISGCCSHAPRGRVHQHILNDMMGADALRWDWTAAPTYFERVAQKYDTHDVAAALEHAICKGELCREAAARGCALDAPSAAVFLCEFFGKMATLARRPAFMGALIDLQKRVRERRMAREHALHGPWGAPGAALPVNSSDAFTLAPIDEIPADMRFSYETKDGRLYAFSAPELSRYVSSSAAALNPFTREPLPEEAQERLAKMTSKMSLSVRQPITVWRTPCDAFVDVLHGFECMGFYSRLEWFSELRGDVIYAIFRVLSTDRHIPSHLFNLEKLDSAMEASHMQDGGHDEDDIENEIEDNLRYVLAQTMRTMLRYPFATQFYTTCKLFLAVVVSHPDPTVGNARDVLPQWLIMGAQAPY